MIKNFLLSFSYGKKAVTMKDMFRTVAKDLRDGLEN